MMAGGHCKDCGVWTTHCFGQGLRHGVRYRYWRCAKCLGDWIASYKKRKGRP